jgi:Ran GTPase-activating protein (RanGAP) involved in mRNA processing and transport
MFFRICKEIIFSSFIEQIDITVFFTIFGRVKDTIFFNQRPENILDRATSSSFGEESTQETEIENECFDFWLQRVCRDVKNNDPTIDEVEIDHYGEQLCSFDSTDMMMLSDAMETNTFVTSLIFRNIQIDKCSAEHLKSILQNNSNSITNLQMEEIHGGGGEGLMATAIALTLNPTSSINTLHLKGNIIDSSSARAIGLMLKSNVCLTELRMCQDSIDEEGISYISLGLASNRTLRVLDLEGNALNDISVSKISNSLVHNDTLEFLCLDFNDFGEFGTRAIASMIRKNIRLKELHLFGNHINSIGAIDLADSLRHNTSLTTLILSFNNIGDEGVKVLAEALKVNTSLTHLSLPSNSIWNEGFQTLGDCLPEMKGLEQLNVGELYDTTAADALLAGLKYNTRLSTLYIQLPTCDESYYYQENDESSSSSSSSSSSNDGDGSSSCHSCTTPVEDDINFFLRLNRSGRSLLNSSHAPTALWSTALEKATINQSETGVPDVLYHLLCEKPDLVNTTSRVSCSSSSSSSS